MDKPLVQSWNIRPNTRQRTPAKATKADMKRHEVRRAIENIKEDLELARESSL